MRIENRTTRLRRGRRSRRAPAATTFCEHCGQSDCPCSDSDMADHVCPVCVGSDTPCITETEE